MKKFSEINLPTGAVPGQPKEVDMVRDVYIPCLSNCTKHQRLIFTFGASVLLDLSDGFEQLIHNGGPDTSR